VRGIYPHAADHAAQWLWTSRQAQGDGHRCEGRPPRSWPEHGGRKSPTCRSHTGNLGTMAGLLCCPSVVGEAHFSLPPAVHVCTTVHAQLPMKCLQLLGGPLKALQRPCQQSDSLPSLLCVLSLQDHPAVLSAFYLKEEAGPISLTDELLHSSGRIRVRAIAKYLLFRKGPLTSTGCDHGAFVSTNGACTMLGSEYSTPHDSKLPLCP